MFFFFFFFSPVVVNAVRMWREALDFSSGATPLETRKCLTQQVIIDYCVLDFWRFHEWHLSDNS